MITIRFFSHDDDRELGTARLIDGKLTSETPGVQSIIDGKVLAREFTGEEAVEYFSSWSNGYIGSSADADSAAELKQLRDRPIRTCGVDLASEPLGTAIVAVDWKDERARARLLDDPARRADDNETVLNVLAAADRVGVDCPFGWPTAFVRAIARHAERDRWHGNGDRRPLRLRATDRLVDERFAVTPLSVSSDKIGAVAMRWAHLMSQHEQRCGPIDRIGSGRVVEVYPALSLEIWSRTDPRWPSTRYREDVSARADLLGWLTQAVDGLAIDAEVFRAAEHPTRGHDVIDALLAALTAAAASTPECTEPLPEYGSELHRDAASEGWINIVRDSSLRRLNPRRLRR